MENCAFFSQCVRLCYLVPHWFFNFFFLLNQISYFLVASSGQGSQCAWDHIIDSSRDHITDALSSRRGGSLLVPCWFLAGCCQVVLWVPLWERPWSPRSVRKPAGSGRIVEKADYLSGEVTQDGLQWLMIQISKEVARSLSCRSLRGHFRDTVQHLPFPMGMWWQFAPLSATTQWVKTSQPGNQVWILDLYWKKSSEPHKGFCLFILGTVP